MLRFLGKLSLLGVIFVSATPASANSIPLLSVPYEGLDLNTLHFPSIPANTASAMEGALGARNFYRVIGDEIEPLFDAYVYAHFGRTYPADMVLSFRLTLVTMFQFLESLSDAGASEASRIRGDWKYALHLPMNFPGFTTSSLRIFRCTNVSQGTSAQIFNELMQWMQQHPQILAVTQEKQLPGENICVVVCRLSWLEWTFDILSDALSVLAAEQPSWLRSKIQLSRYTRYAQDVRLYKFPWALDEQHDLAQTVSTDIAELLHAVDEDGGPELVLLPEVQLLRSVIRCQESACIPLHHALKCRYCARHRGW